MSKPEDEPLGGKPILPVPSEAAQKRAHPLFNRYLAESRGDAERSEEGQADWEPSPHDEPTRIVSRSSMVSTPLPMSEDDSPTRAQRAFASMRFASGRRYDQTLAFIQSMAGPLPGVEDPVAFVDDADVYPDVGADYDAPQDVDADELARLDALAGVERTVVAPAPDRPPPFAPMVRPSPPPRRGPETVDDASLASLVDTSMLIANPDGSAAFEIAFDDEVFQNLACSITVGPEGVVATFKVSDPNTRRLLEAEAGNLRVRLSERGLRVAEVRVVTE